MTFVALFCPVDDAVSVTVFSGSADQPYREMGTLTVPQDRFDALRRVFEAAGVVFSECAPPPDSVRRQVDYHAETCGPLLQSAYRAGQASRPDDANPYRRPGMQAAWEQGRRDRP